MILLQKSLPLDKAARCDVGNNEEVLVTPIDANHCPGSVMSVTVLSPLL
jgi:hypothetical protein